MTRHVACVSGSLSEEQKAQLLQRFKVLCVTGLQEAQQTNGGEAALIRCNCCYNLPVRLQPVAPPHIWALCSPAAALLHQAVLLFSDASHFLTELYASFCGLCCDPEVSVRQSAAACFHQVGCDFFGVVMTMAIREQVVSARCSRSPVRLLTVRWQSCWDQTSIWCTKSSSFCCKTMLWRSVRRPGHTGPRPLSCLLNPQHLSVFALLLVEVLDALMDHLEETLQMVISKGENLLLDNKGVKVVS